MDILNTETQVQVRTNLMPEHKTIGDAFREKIVAMLRDNPKVSAYTIDEESPYVHTESGRFQVNGKVRIEIRLVENV